MSRPVVLVHGAWHGGWCFERVVPPLEARGIRVHAPDLPFKGEREDVAAARKLLEREPGAVVLGHSYGGLVITHAAAGLDVSHLVYLCAFVPNPDDTVATLMRSAPPTALTKGGVVANADGTATVEAGLATEAFYGRCAPSDVERALARLRPIPLGAEPALGSEPAWSTTPSTYVVCTEDQALAPAFQREQARRATHVVEWETDHSPFFSTPDLLVDLLVRLATA